MTKDLHNNDEFFRSAYREFEEEPSPAVWEKINAGLEKKDSGSYIKKISGWKRTAIVLLLLLACIVLYESGILKSGKGKSAKKYDVEKNNPASLNSNADGISKKDITYQNEIAVKNSYKNFSKDNKAGLLNNLLPVKIITYPNDADLKRSSDPVPGISGGFEKNIVEKLINSPAVYPGTDVELLLKSLSSAGKKIKKNDVNNSVWLITAIASYEAAGYKLDSELPSEISDIKHREVHEPSFSAGFLITRRLTNHLSVQSGLLYSNTDIGIGPQKIFAFLDPAGDVAYKYVTSSGYAYIKPKTGAPPSFGDSLVAAEGKHTLQYLTLPLVVKYRAGNSKLSFVPGIGIEANFLTGTRVETELQTPSNNEVIFVNKLYGAKSFYFSLAADAEVRYDLNRRIALSLHPSYHHAISPITENNVIETFPYSFRWGVGLTIRL